MSFEDKQSEIQMQFPNMIQDLDMEESANFE